MERMVKKKHMVGVRPRRLIQCQTEVNTENWTPVGNANLK